jgi:hypothetical protein
MLVALERFFYSRTQSYPQKLWTAIGKFVMCDAVGVRLYRAFMYTETRFCGTRLLSCQK